MCFLKKQYIYIYSMLLCLSSWGTQPFLGDGFVGVDLDLLTSPERPIGLEVVTP